MDQESKLSPAEEIKKKSRGLRGTLVESLENQVTGALYPDDQNLIKFHGIYQQDDRDRREDRDRKKLELAYTFMIRLRIPAGDISALQWLGIRKIADQHSTGVIKITTRQTVQLHGVVKAQMKPTVKWFSQLGLDAIAACGDVNRNVISGSNPSVSVFHAEVHAFADKLSLHLLPRTRAFYEIWLDNEKLGDSGTEEDPLYQDRYLPRKFKIAIAIPPHNDVDVFAHDIGLIAIAENGKFIGFNLLVGGGMAATHGNAATYPRLGTIIGFIPKEKTLETAWQIVAVQRDFGNRTDRSLARLKYTVDRMGVDGFKTELEKRLDFKITDEKSYKFTHRGDIFGWVQDADGQWYYTLFVENGRVVDIQSRRVRAFLDKVAETGLSSFRFTANQNVMLTYIDAANKPAIEKLLAEYGIDGSNIPITTKAAMACVALPTCPLALAEAQRYLPDLLVKIEALLAKNGMQEQGVSIRMTGCPNGCARPYLAEIGLVGKSVGKYNLRLGGDDLGLRLNQPYQEDQDETQILETLDSLFGQYKSKAQSGESFGDYILSTRPPS